MYYGLERNLAIILDSFPIDSSSTEEIIITNLRKDSRLFIVDTSSKLLKNNIDKVLNLGEIYILDTKSAMQIACHPPHCGGTIK
jgi:hypothetical protein